MRKFSRKTRIITAGAALAALAAGGGVTAGVLLSAPPQTPAQHIASQLDSDGYRYGHVTTVQHAQLGRQTISALYGAGATKDGSRAEVVMYFKPGTTAQPMEPLVKTVVAQDVQVRQDGSYLIIDGTPAQFSKLSSSFHGG